jgi:hypothetical protein
MEARRAKGLVARQATRLARNPDILTIRIPRADWVQIVSDIENMCGCGRDEIEILQSVEVDPVGWLELSRLLAVKWGDKVIDPAEVVYLLRDPS